MSGGRGTGPWWGFVGGTGGGRGGGVNSTTQDGAVIPKQVRHRLDGGGEAWGEVIML